MKRSLCNSWKDAQKLLQPFTKHPINLSLSSNTSEKKLYAVNMRRSDFPVISTDLHRRHAARVGGNGSSLIGASLQEYTWLTVRHTAGFNGPRNIIHQYVMGYAHKSFRLAYCLQGRMEGMRAMLSAAADGLGEFSYSPILSDGSSELSMHICSKGCALALFMQHGLFKRWHRLQWGDRARI